MEDTPNMSFVYKLKECFERVKSGPFQTIKILLYDGENQIYQIIMRSGIEELEHTYSLECKVSLEYIEKMGINRFIRTMYFSFVSSARFLKDLDYFASKS